MTLVQRFLRYVSFDTQSAEDKHKCPSTDGQITLARQLETELQQIGLDDIYLDQNGYLYATLPANTPNTQQIPTIGFIAHIDTSPDCSGHNVKPRIIQNYDGKDITLCPEQNIITSPKYFPELLNHIGEDLIVTDGHTLLGADDKAGIAEIVQAMVYLKEHPEIKHGKIRIAFNPDEEIGLGAHLFNVELFGADWAYTMDGSEVGELEYENFNAASAKITFNGLNVHPGYAKNKMRNSMTYAAQFINNMPQTQTPEQTQEYQGFYHLTNINGTVEQTTLTYIIRDHDNQLFQERKNYINQLAQQINRQHGQNTVTVTINDQYKNMRQMIEPNPQIINIAQQAMQCAGTKCTIRAIRGGTDGAQLSFKGLPCPNIFAGGLCFHSRHEFIPIQSMQQAMMTIVHIARLTAQQYSKKTQQ